MTNKKNIHAKSAHQSRRKNLKKWQLELLGYKIELAIKKYTLYTLRTIFAEKLFSI